MKKPKFLLFVSILMVLLSGCVILIAYNMVSDVIDRFFIYGVGLLGLFSSALYYWAYKITKN